MSPQALYLAPHETTSGTTLTIDLPADGPTPVRIPPVRPGKLLAIATATDEVFFRVRVVRPLGDRLRQIVIALIFGLLLMSGPIIIIGGATSKPLPPGGVPTCGGQPMGLSDTCEVRIRNGGRTETNEYDYSQMQAQQQASTGGVVVIGVCITVAEVIIGGGVLARYLVWRNKPVVASIVGEQRF